METERKTTKTSMMTRHRMQKNPGPMKKRPLNSENLQKVESETKLA